MSVRSVCDRGFRVYLAEQHRMSMKKALSHGLVAGGIATGCFALVNHFGKLDADWWITFALLPMITVVSVGVQSVGEHSEDLEHKEAFDSICSKYDEKDEEDGE